MEAGNERGWGQGAPALTALVGRGKGRVQRHDADKLEHVAELDLVLWHVVEFDNHCFA